MKFSGEIKFPEIDHPGVPVSFLVEGSQVELVVEDESLGRWSLYDVHARRLVASAFQIDLDGTEVTFVADDPIDFAYRGVEHMAETWATLKSKRIATRALAIRKTRKGTTPSRIEDMKAAMVANLEDRSAPGRIAGEGAMPPGTETEPDLTRDAPAGEWDQRDLAASIPVVDAETETPVTEPAAGLHPDLTREAQHLEEERRSLEEERARFEKERRLAERQEADRIEAYRLEMQRLQAEREALRGQDVEEGTAKPGDDRIEEALSGALTEPVIGSGADRIETEPEGADAEPEVAEPEEPALEMAESEVAEPEEPALEMAEPEEPEPEEPEPEEPEPEEPEPEEPEEVEDELEPADLDQAEPGEPEPPGPGVVDLSDLEEEETPDETPPEAPAPTPAEPRPLVPQKQPEPAMSGVSRERSGLMGAVRAAFRGGARDHEHRFIEAPGGIGITRYVCEECGYVSISV